MTDKPNCATKDCDREAVLFPLLRVPPMGEEMDKAVQGYVHLPLCGDHAPELTVRDLTDADKEGNLRFLITQALGLAIPDFHRAELEFALVGSDEWHVFQARRARTLN